ncbi:MAG: tetratricopeptide repeat protein [Candidatus Acidiferrales bacterium]
MPNSEKKSAASESGGASAPSETGSLLGSRRIQSSLVALVLAIATFFLYLPCTHHDFVNYDDPDYVTANVHVHQGLTWSNVSWAFTTTDAANWHPLTWISHMADVQFFGADPSGHHLDSILWHTLNVVLLFVLLVNATGYLGRSTIVVALFAFSPLNVEPVAWIAERKTLLCAAFFFLALFAYAWYTRKPGVVRYLVVALLFAMSLMSKPMSVTLPFVLLLLDYWPLERLPLSSDPHFGARFRKLLVEKIPLLALSVGSVLMAMRAGRLGGAVGSTLLLPMSLRIENAIYSYALYIWKGIWPSKLAVFYPHPENTLALWKVAAAAVILIAISALVWRYREKRFLVVGWLWYLGTLLPMIGLTQAGRQGMADRYTYISFLGLFVIVVWLGSELAARVPSAKSALAALALLAAAGYAGVASVQMQYWVNSYALFHHAVDVTSHNDMAENNLGEALVEMGHPEMANEHFETAISYRPSFSLAHYNFATLLQSQNRTDDAIREYRAALQSVSDPEEAARAHNNLGTVLLQSNRDAEALAEYNAALSIDPNQANSLTGRGLIEYRKGDLPHAQEDFTQAAKVAHSSIALFWLGRTLEDRGDKQSAIAAYNEALGINPGLEQARTRVNALHNSGPP